MDKILEPSSLYFPNLRSISIENIGIVPEEMFVHFSKLEFLRQIKINGQSRGQFSISDEMFTRPCESQLRRESITAEFAPAIAAFKILGVFKN